MTLHVNKPKKEKSFLSTIFGWLTGSSELFHGSVLEPGTSDFLPSTGEAEEIYECVGCHHDTTEIMLKVM